MFGQAQKEVLDGGEFGLFGSDGFDLEEGAEALDFVPGEFPIPVLPVEFPDGALLANGVYGPESEQEEHFAEIVGRLQAVTEGDFDFLTRFDEGIELGAFEGDEVPLVDGADAEGFIGDCEVADGVVEIEILLKEGFDSGASEVGDALQEGLGIA